MTTPRGRGRPFKGTHGAPLTPLGVAVVAALQARKDAMAEGPRNQADLARVVGICPAMMVRVLNGLRPMAPPVMAAIIVALPEVQAPPLAPVAAVPHGPSESEIEAVLSKFDDHTRALALHGRALVAAGKKPRTNRQHECLDVWGAVCEALESNKKPPPSNTQETP